MFPCWFFPRHLLPDVYSSLEMKGFVFSAWGLTTAQDLLLWDLLLGQAHQVWCWEHGKGCT